MSRIGILIAASAISLAAAPAVAASSAHDRVATTADTAANRLVKRVNHDREEAALKVATPRAVASLMRYREQGYRFGGRAQNGCDAAGDGDFICPAVVFKNGVTQGGVYLTVRRVEGSYVVTRASVSLGE